MAEVAWSFKDVGLKTSLIRDRRRGGVSEMLLQFNNQLTCLEVCT